MLVMTQPFAVVTSPSNLLNSSSFLTASYMCLDTIIAFLLSLPAFHASSRTWKTGGNSRKLKKKEDAGREKRIWRNPRRVNLNLPQPRGIWGQQRDRQGRRRRRARRIFQPQWNWRFSRRELEAGLVAMRCRLLRRFGAQRFSTTDHESYWERNMSRIVRF